MSVFSTALASALSTIAAATGESLTYRTTTGGAFVALSGFVFIRDRPAGATYEDRHNMEAFTTTGVLKGPLTPAFAIGYQVTDGNSNVWAVLDVKSEQQQICPLKRVSANVLGPDRGGAN